MKVVLQRVAKASVSVDGSVVGEIGQGYLLLLGAEDSDTEEIVDKMMDKICRLRIFRDEEVKTNRSLADVDGEILVISQFTLYADCRKGNRPSFIRAGAPEKAEALYERALELCDGEPTCAEKLHDWSYTIPHGTSYNGDYEKPCR